jgi:hypothetical protein
MLFYEQTFKGLNVVVCSLLHVSILVINFEISV